VAFFAILSESLHKHLWWTAAADNVNGRRRQTTDNNSEDGE